MLEPKKIEEYRKDFEEERKHLLEEVAMLEKPEDFGSDIESDSSEETNEAESLSDNLAAGQSLKDRINEIDAAMNRMRLGVYGKCLNCGKEISSEVLAVAPESAWCALQKMYPARENNEDQAQIGSH